jgi:hypothetical protein
MPTIDQFRRGPKVAKRLRECQEAQPIDSPIAENDYLYPVVAIRLIIKSFHQKVVVYSVA